MPVRDIQYKNAMLATEVLNLTNTPGDFAGSAIYTKGFTRGLMVGFELAAALDVSDVIQYRFQGSADGSTGWTDLASDAILPTWNQANTNKIIDTTANDPAYLQTAGTADNEYDYVRVVLKVVSLVAATLDVTVIPVMEADQTPFVGFSSTNLPNDGLP